MIQIVAIQLNVEVTIADIFNAFVFFVHLIISLIKFWPVFFINLVDVNPSAQMNGITDAGNSKRKRKSDT